MPKSELRLIKHALEYLPNTDIAVVPKLTRGIYVLYHRRGRANVQSHHYDVVCIGMAAKSIRTRLNVHYRNKNKLWTHFSFFEIWDNISDDEIAELEGLFRHLYRFDSKANMFNSQRGYKKLYRLRRKTEKEWDYKP